MAALARLAIVGAGLAGLAAAVGAGDAELEVDVFEAEAALAAPPAHIDLVPALWRDLVALGVGPACVRRGFAYSGVACLDFEGKARFRIETPSLAGPHWPAALGMPYGALLQALLQEAEARGVRLHWGDPVARCDARGEEVMLETRRGASWRGDAVLLAGARDLQGLPRPLVQGARVLPQRWDHVLLPRPRDLDRTTWVVGPGRNKALLVPVGVSQMGLALLREADSARSVDGLRAQLAAQGPLLAGIGASLHDGTPIASRAVRSGLMAGPWHEGMALRIGSSAHVLPPHFGQAAAQAVEDAVVLQDLLRAGLHRDEVFARFMQRRASRAEQVHRITTQAADWDHHPEPSTDLHALAQRLAPVIEQPA